MSAGVGALDGVRVLDLTRFVSGPLCTFFLASMGAEVITVEPPGGSTSRRLAPLAAADGSTVDIPAPDAMSVPFLKRARGKRSVAIALDNAEGVALVAQLTERVDVLVENARPGALAAMSLGYDELAPRNPRLVYCSVSGYGQEGPRAQDGAMDQVVQAESGLMAKTGFADGPPARTGTTVGDHSAATFAALGIVAALRERDRSGHGQHVDVSMLDVLTAMVWDEPVDAYARAGFPVRTGNADPRGAPINAYECRDGWISLCLTSDEQWRKLAPELGRPEWQDAMPSIRERAAAAAEIDAAMEEWARGRSAEDAEHVLRGCGVPAGVVRAPLAAGDDVQIEARGLLETLRHPSGTPTEFRGPRLPIAFTGRVDELAPAERLGASTDAILAGYLAIGDEELADLRARGVIA